MDGFKDRRRGTQRFQLNHISREDRGQQRRFNFLCEKIKQDVMIHHLISVLIIDLTTE